MSTRITRRRLITTAVTAAAGASGIGVVASIANRYGLIPPDHQGLYGVGETLTYAAQRVLTGLVYVLSGLVTKHFRSDLLPARSHLAAPLLSSSSDSYNLVQRVTYLGVVFVLFPLIVVTGLAMSPAVTSVMPWLATMFGGHQSARTIHFFAASAVTLFVIGHVTMVVAAGFAVRVMAMITGGRETVQEHV